MAHRVSDVWLGQFCGQEEKADRDRKVPGSASGFGSAEAAVCAGNPEHRDRDDQNAGGYPVSLSR